jgi:hypothetical protein
MPHNRWLTWPSACMSAEHVSSPGIG